MVRVIDARPNNNYWHLVDVWNAGPVDNNQRTRLLNINYIVDVRVSGSAGSWPGPKNFSVWMDGGDHPRSVGYDTRNGADFVAVSAQQWVYAGDGRQVEVHAFFEGHSSSFPGFHDTGGRFWVDGVAPAVPPANVPGVPYVDPKIVNIGHTDFGVNYASPSDGGSPITTFQVVWRRVRDGVDVWYDNNSWGYTNPAGGAGPALELGTEYDVFVRAGNNVGWGNFSAPVRGRTLAGARVRVGGVWKQAVAYVRVNGVWRQAIPYVRRAGVWRDAK